ncbi:uncharacterized protein TRIADDRAFT_62181 [Trichoplax adhaerens]|uniref:EamA domain-containing protein n=1 Tax=Trichoplax adhaerens TaxID=10228 RepID=B3SD24_TRIAD|nr:hypothetical protein TRIADDRAFT_62181 [Trichoplax adhaerens]EDV19364.1 hypothetical protein TRIADDRAFT_62181 [Trichoplax adhaerens]|eukprot:XP_002118139.1 hypothetical protein TRIADDRAFT_62181 [Trichoplax adhaerens]
MEHQEIEKSPKGVLSDMDRISVNSYDAAVDTHRIRWNKPQDTEGTPEVAPCGLSQKTFKMLAGLVIVIAIAVSWVGSTQFAQSTYSATFFAPYFTTWFSTCWIIVCYPTMLLVGKLKGRSFTEMYRESETIYGPRGLCLMNILKIALPFCICWIVANFLYIYALGLIQPSDVTAIFSSTSAFVYVFSLIWLKESFMILRAMATAISIVGIVLFAYSDGFGRFQLVGVFLTVGGSIAASLYKVWLKRVVGNASFNQIGFFLSVLGLLNLLLFWPIILILYYTNAETIDWNNLPITFLCGSAVLGVAFNFLVNFGIAFTFPLFISLGTVIGIPINALVDTIFRQKSFGAIKIGGSACIIIGFLVMLIGDEKSRQISDNIMSILCCGRSVQFCHRSTDNLKEDELESDPKDIPSVADMNSHNKIENGVKA